MKVLPLSEVKMKLSQLVEEVSSLDEEITITRNGKPVAIIVSPDEFDSWKETLAIRADAELMAEIRRGLEDIKKKRQLYTLEELFAE
jgi:prevent-host-death family protein